MQKIIKLFKAIWLLLKRPALFNLILKDEEVLRNEFEKVFPALKLQEFDPFAWTEAQELKIAPYAFLSGSSMVTDFAFLQMLCRKYKVETYL
ncbi:MAG: hypothetical protein RIS63_1137, partial [Bacteroidota bacterium]